MYMKNFNTLNSLSIEFLNKPSELEFSNFYLTVFYTSSLLMYMKNFNTFNSLSIEFLNKPSELEFSNFNKKIQYR